jgi:hypothetical protein
VEEEEEEDLLLEEPMSARKEGKVRGTIAYMICRRVSIFF